MVTYMVDVEKCIKQINAMSKTDFHQRILRGVAASEEFSCLVSIGIKYLTQGQKQHICQMLVQAGIPFEFSDNPDLRLFQSLCKLEKLIVRYVISY